MGRQTEPLTLFIDKLNYYAKVQPLHNACVFQPRGIETAEYLNYEQLMESVSQRANLLFSLGFKGKSLALLFPSGLDFVLNFFACMAAGAIAVPLNVTRNEQQLKRTLIILEDAQVQGILTTKEVKIGHTNLLNNLPSDKHTHYTWIDELHPSQSTTMHQLPKLSAEDTAFIQYTSGSTSSPKGVVVSHGNIVENMKAISDGCGHDKGVVVGGWLPQFHDMGLVGHMLNPLYMGGTYVFMPPMNFIQRPKRWLELISQHKIFCSASPNFGYEHCLNLIRDSNDLSHIDLSNWKVALNGSEPVSAHTMELFSEKFKHLGFDANAFAPCYGMAEATLFISGRKMGSGVHSLTLDAAEFEQGMVLPSQQGKSVVNCGVISECFKTKIVNPKTCQVCMPNKVGEIWLYGDSVAQGYLNLEQKTQDEFHAQLVPTDGRRYLRTGDMGFIYEGMLYVTGRIKELIIIRGKNFYPYDIERTCNSYEHASGGNGCSVFSYEDNGITKLAGILEVSKRSLLNVDIDMVKEDIRALVSDQHELSLDKLLVVKPGFIPKTTSGKVKRAACSELI